MALKPVLLVEVLGNLLKKVLLITVNIAMDKVP